MQGREHRRFGNVLDAPLKRQDSARNFNNFSLKFRQLLDPKGFSHVARYCLRSTSTLKSHTEQFTD